MKLYKLIVLFLLGITNLKLNADIISDLTDAKNQIIDNINKLQNEINSKQIANDPKSKDGLLAQIQNLSDSLKEISEDILNVVNLKDKSVFVIPYIDSLKIKINDIAKDTKNITDTLIENAKSSLTAEASETSKQIEDLKNSFDAIQTQFEADSNNFITQSVDILTPEQLFNYIFDENSIKDFKQNITQDFTKKQNDYSNYFENFSNKINAAIKEKITFSQTLSSKLLNDFNNFHKQEKGKINDLFNSTIDNLKNIAQKIVDSFSQINKSIKGIGNEIILLLTYVSNICDNASKLLNGILNFPLIPPLTLGDTFIGDVKRLITGLKSDIDLIKQAVDHLISGGMPDLTYIYYVVYNLFKSIINCPAGTVGLAGSIYTNLGAITIAQPGYDKSYLEILKNVQTVLGKNVDDLIAAGSEWQTLIKSGSLDQINKPLKELINNVSGTIDSVANIFELSLIQTLNGLYTNMHFAPLCFKQTSDDECNCPKQDPDFNLHYCLSNDKCPCICDTFKAVKDIQKLISNINKQIDDVAKDLKNFESDIAATVGLDIGIEAALIIGVISAAWKLKKFLSYNEFEEELSDLGLNRLEVKNITSKLTKDDLIKIQEKFSEYMENPEKANDFINYFSGKVGLDELQAKDFLLRNTTLRNQFQKEKDAQLAKQKGLIPGYDDYLKISKIFENIPEDIFLKNVDKFKDLYNKIENANNSGDLFNALSELSQLTGISKNELLENYRENFSPGFTGKKISSQDLDNLSTQIGKANIKQSTIDDFKAQLKDQLTKDKVSITDKDLNVYVKTFTDKINSNEQILYQPEVLKDFRISTIENARENIFNNILKTSQNPLELESTASKLADLFSKKLELTSTKFTAKDVLAIAESDNPMIAKIPDLHAQNALKITDKIVQAKKSILNVPDEAKLTFKNQINEFENNFTSLLNKPHTTIEDYINLGNKISEFHSNIIETYKPLSLEPSHIEPLQTFHPIEPI